MKLTGKFEQSFYKNNKYHDALLFSLTKTVSKIKEMSVNKYFNLGKNILFPINRSITGKGVRDTLKIIKNEFPIFNIKKIKSGSKVYDWVIPPEWNVSNALVEDKIKKNNSISKK